MKPKIICIGIVYFVLAYCGSSVVAQTAIIDLDKLTDIRPLELDMGNANSTSLSQTPQLNHKKQCRSVSLFDEISFLFSVAGSKQPQDFGVNANLGGNASVNWGIPIFKEYGIGAQVGSGITASSNAVRVYELLGESTGRTQSFTTVGLFQRTESDFAWGFVHDFLHEKSYDSFRLGQWRIRGSYLVTSNNEVGVTSTLQSYSDNGTFGSNTQVTLNPIDQGSLYYRRFWGTGAQTTAWFGIADKHGENNAVTGPSPIKKVPFLFGADVLMPLTSSLVIYGETNMIMPSDTGTVDAFLGVQWYPGGRAFRARRGKYSPLMSLASPTSFAVDLAQ